MSDQKACPSCGESIKAVAKKCRHCGERISQDCPNCGEAIKASAKKCLHCGEWVRGGSPARRGRPKGDPSAAFLLELLPGLFLAWFGWGHIYNGQVGKGLLIMFGHWIIQTANLFLMMFIVGFVTAPLTWVFFLIFSSLDAKKVAEGRG